MQAVPVPVSDKAKKAKKWKADRATAPSEQAALSLPGAQDAPIPAKVGRVSPVPVRFLVFIMLPFPKWQLECRRALNVGSARARIGQGLEGQEEEGGTPRPAPSGRYAQLPGCGYCCHPGSCYGECCLFLYML